MGGDPEPRVTWFKDGRKLRGKFNWSCWSFIAIFSRSSFIISSFHSSETYTCVSMFFFYIKSILDIILLFIIRIFFIPESRRNVKIIVSKTTHSLTILRYITKISQDNDILKIQLYKKKIENRAGIWYSNIYRCDSSWFGNYSCTAVNSVGTVRYK